MGIEKETEAQLSLDFDKSSRITKMYKRFENFKRMCLDFHMVKTEILKAMRLSEAF